MISKSLGKLHKVGARGEDNQGRTYASLEQMWQNQMSVDANAASNGEAAATSSPEESKTQPAGNKANWYNGSVDYWDKQPATVDGVLGGYETIHETESDTSRAMIEAFKPLMPSMGLALDCGAGIGRVTKFVLKPMFETVDLVEPSTTQLEEAKNYCPEARNFYHKGLQEFAYENKYDAVWIQWVLCYLTDHDLAEFLLKTKAEGLTQSPDGKKSGLIFVKENVHSNNTFMVDRDDNSVMRTHKQFEAIFLDTGFQILRDTIQKGMPDELHHIRCYVLKPIQ